MASIDHLQFYNFEDFLKILDFFWRKCRFQVRKIGLKIGFTRRYKIPNCRLIKMLLINEWNNSCNRFHIDMRLDLSTICLTVLPAPHISIFCLFVFHFDFDLPAQSFFKIHFRESHLRDKKGQAYDLHIREKISPNSYAPLVSN